MKINGLVSGKNFHRKAQFDLHWKRCKIGKSMVNPIFPGENRSIWVISWDSNH
jgi:hypothetical protein